MQRHYFVDSTGLRMMITVTGYIQNVDALPHTNPTEIKANLIAQLTASVRWSQAVQNMIKDGADDFTECGPGKALCGMISKINKEVSAHAIK